MQTIRQSCLTALRCRNALLLPSLSRRAFSQSPIVHRGALPVFLPSSTPELANSFSLLNAKVLLPYHLTKEQQKLVYSQESRAKLEAEPIEITLGDVTLPLEHIDRNRDLPSMQSVYRRIISLSSTPGDWENVIRMMEGFANAGKVKMHWWEQIVRKLQENGMQHLILKCVQRADDTGLHLREWDVVTKVMWAVRDKAANAGWEKEELVKALSMAEQIVELMERDTHLGKVQGDQNWRTHPSVIAVPLELAAELAYRHEGDISKVKVYATRLMAALHQRGYVDSSCPELKRFQTLIDTPSDKPSKFLPNIITNIVMEMQSQIPVWNALSTTRTVLEESMPQAEDAEQVQKALWAMLEQGMATMERLTTDKNISMDMSKGYPLNVKKAIDMCMD